MHNIQILKALPAPEFFSPGTFFPTLCYRSLSPWLCQYTWLLRCYDLEYQNDTAENSHCFLTDIFNCILSVIWFMQTQVILPFWQALTDSHSWLSSFQITGYSRNSASTKKRLQTFKLANYSISHQSYVCVCTVDWNFSLFTTIHWKFRLEFFSMLWFLLLLICFALAFYLNFLLDLQITKHSSEEESTYCCYNQNHFLWS